jgi:hypothetical protein
MTVIENPIVGPFPAPISSTRPTRTPSTANGMATPGPGQSPSKQPHGPDLLTAHNRRVKPVVVVTLDSRALGKRSKAYKGHRSPDDWARPSAQFADKSLPCNRIVPLRGHYSRAGDTGDPPTAAFCESCEHQRWATSEPAAGVMHPTTRVRAQGQGPMFSKWHGQGTGTKGR